MKNKIWSVEKDGVSYRPAVTLPVDENASDGFKEKMAEAFLILSQSRTGRHLLTEAGKQGYEVSEDAPEMREIRNGMAIHEEKKIRLNPELPAPQLALILGHEAAHTLQEPWKESMTVKNMNDKIKVILAGEADAYAHEMQIALELAHGDPKGPKTQYINKDLVDSMYEQNPFFPFITALHGADEIISGKVMPSFFNAFYECDEMRGKYERNLAAIYNETCSKLAGFVKSGDVSPTDAEPLLFPQNKVSDQTLLQGIQFHGKPYLTDVKADFSSAFYAGVATDNKRAIVGAFKGLGMSDKAMASLEKIPVFDETAQDLLGRIRAAVADMNRERAENNGQSPTLLKLKSGRLTV